MRPEVKVMGYYLASHISQSNGVGYYLANFSYVVFLRSRGKVS